MQQEIRGNAVENGNAPNGNHYEGAENGAPVPSLTANGMLPTTSAPLKPSIYAPEMSSAREEPAPPTSHTLPADDPSTANAAASAAQSSSLEPATTADDPAAPATLASESTEEVGEEAAQPAVLPPAHEADAKGLNGSGLASTQQQAEPSEEKAVDVTASDEPAGSAVEAPASIATGPQHAPGTQNPYNESEEKTLAATAPSGAAAQPSNNATVPSSEEASTLETRNVDDHEATGPEPKAPDAEPADQAVPAASAAEAADDVPPVETKMEDVTPAPSEAITVPSSQVASAVAAPSSETAAPPAAASESAGSTAVESQLAGPEATEMTAAQIKACQAVIKSLKGRPESPPFLQPVDPVALNIPHYATIIEQPMDLGTVDIKLALTAAAQKGGNKPTEKTKQAAAWKLDPSRDVYRTIDDFERDVRLVFNNCIVFNGPEHVLSKSVESLQAVFEKQLKSMHMSAQAGPSTPAEADVSTEIGLTRRPSEASASSRPKRDIHPPAPKDLPYADRPQAATGTGGRRRKSIASMSAREAAHYQKTAREQLRYVSKVIDDMHKAPLSDLAWVFYEKPAMDLNFAEAYYAIIKRPISLKEIKARLVTGEYEDVEGPKEDFNLMLNNCFTFNEPNSDVYKMGEQVKKAWEAKLEKLPRPSAPVDLDYTEDDDEDDDDEEDEENYAKAQAIRDQIAALQATLEGLQGSSKVAGSKAIASAQASLAAIPSKKAPKRRASESGPSSSKKAGAKKAKASTGSAAYRDASDTKKPKSKKSTGVRKRDEEVREVTYEQKEELAAKITQLPDDRLDGALRIIAEDKPPSANDDEEIELDIDDLSPATLYKLYRYVVRPKGKKETKSKLSASDGRKRGTGGVKRKNLDEEEEAARIARLQQQLQQFESADGIASSGAAPAQAAAPKAAAGHDDLVASDTSSGEEDSDSESDY